MPARFELISAFAAPHRQDDSAPAGEEDPPPDSAFTLTTAQGLVFLQPDGDGGGLTLSGDARDAVGLRVVQQQTGMRLAALLPRGSLVNGRPALPLAVLQSRDLLSTPWGGLFYVSERVTPYFGRATAAIAGQKCPVCRLKIEPQDWVLDCRCGVVVHFETPETTPEKNAEDRCDCGVHLKACIACGQPLSREPYLVFDPRDL